MEIKTPRMMGRKAQDLDAQALETSVIGGVKHAGR